jgi:hypothetical protein
MLQIHHKHMYIRMGFKVEKIDVKTQLELPVLKEHTSDGVVYTR